MKREEKKRSTSLTSRLAKKALNRVYNDIEETVVPRTEDFVFDIFSSIISGFSNLIIGAFEGLIYRDSDGPGSSRGSSRGDHDYMKYYRNGRRGNTARRGKEEKKEIYSEFTDGLISCRNYNEIYYDNRQSAEKLLRRLKNDIGRYNDINVSTLYEYLRKTGGDFTDSYYGWNDLSGARVQPAGPRKYLVRLPEPEDLR